jgi:hypothetical protein
LWWRGDGPSPGEPADQRLIDTVEQSPDVDFVLWDLTGPAPAERFDLLVPPYMGKPAALDAVEVGLVQSQSIGYDGVAAVLPAGCVLPIAVNGERRRIHWIGSLNQQLPLQARPIRKYISLLLAGERL